MAWPTVDELRAQYDKLAYYTDDEVIEPFIEDAVGRVLGVMAEKYNVSNWAAATPTEAKKWAKWLAYAYANTKAHTGSAQDGGDALATTLRDRAEAEMKAVIDGAPLLGLDGLPLPISPQPSYPDDAASTVLVRTLLPIHTMGPPEQSDIYLPDSPAASSGYLNRRSRWR